MERSSPLTLLVNFFYAQQLGHAVEALYYAHGYCKGNPDLKVSVALNAATPVELAHFCPFISKAYPVAHSFLEPEPHSSSCFHHLPRRWSWIVDDARRQQDLQLSLFPGLRDYYRKSDDYFVAEQGRGLTGCAPPHYARHQQLRLKLPCSAQNKAVHKTGEGRALTLMPAGSSDRASYPSCRSWMIILDALAEAFPEVRINLMGRLAQSDRTSTNITLQELEQLLSHPSRPVNCFDLPLVEQLAIVERSAVFVAPHTGFGLAALAVGTPWLTLSGGRWFEYFFNHVPFRSILPNPHRYPSFSQFDSQQLSSDAQGPRIPSMTEQRIIEDLDRLVEGAAELLDGELSYDRALREYFSTLLELHQGDESQLWSIDNVHAEYLPISGECSRRSNRAEERR